MVGGRVGTKSGMEVWCRNTYVSGFCDVEILENLILVMYEQAESVRVAALELSSGL